MKYEWISDRHGGRYGVPIEPPVWLGPLEDEEDISDVDRDEGVESIQADPIAAFVPPAADPVDPPPAAADDVLQTILQTM